MKLIHPLFFASRSLGFGAMLAFTCASLQAQVTSTTPGDIAAYSNVGDAAITTNPGDVIDVPFGFDELSGAPLAASSPDLILSQGKYLVLYSTRINNVSGPTRAEVVTSLTLEAAGSGTPLTLPHGHAQGYIRNAEAANDAVISGGAVVEAASTGDILRLQVTRTDANTGKIAEIATGATSIQFLKLDDSWDYLRLSQSFGVAAAATASFEALSYDVVDEGSAGAMSFTSGSTDVTFNEAGRYLVLANTHLQKPNDATRTAYTQRLTLDGTPVTGSFTTTYLRGNPDADNANDGVAAIGILVEAAAGQVLNVQTSREAGTTANTAATGTGLAIVQLPSIGQYLSLSDTSGQDINPVARTAMTFGTQEGLPGSDFSHTPGASAVTVNKAGRYLFLGAFFTNDDGLAVNGDSAAQRRQVPWQQWAIDGGAAFYGGSSQYSRDLNANMNGNWSGILLDLSVGNMVEMTMGRLGADGTSSGDSMGLQAVGIDSLFPSDDPEIALNNPLSLVVSSSGVITGSLLQTADANSAAADLTYTVTSVPTGGTLRLSGGAIGQSSTFTQENINNGDLSFDAGGVAGTFGFDLTVVDEDGGLSDSATFTVEIGLATVVAPDTATTDEDTAISLLDGAVASVLDNDAGTGLAVVGFDATSAQGASVSVNPDGTFTYTPGAAPPLQALAVSEQVVDTFTYTVIDFSNTTTQVQVSVTVNGVNDAPVVASESRQGGNGASSVLNLLNNESDTDASDVLTIANFEDAIFGQGGAVPTARFNFEYVPLVFTSQFGVTVRVSADGTFVYDRSTSTILLGLNPGISVSETFSYDVFDGTATGSTTVVVSTTGVAAPIGDYATTPGNATVGIAILDNDQLRKAGGGVGTPTPGAVLEFVADSSQVVNSDATWFNTGSASLPSVSLNGAGVASILNTTLSNPPLGVSAAYSLSGTGSGAPHEDGEMASMGDFDTVSSTFEFVFRPSDQVGREILWEAGGNGNGISFALIDNLIVMTESDTAPEGAQAVAPLPPSVMAGGEFVHVMGQVDLAGNKVSLYVNGLLAGEGLGINTSTGAPADITDMSGTDNGGIGLLQGTPAGNNFNGPGIITTDLLTPFAGEFAVMRVYTSLLTQAQITANVDAIFGSPSPADVGDLIGVAGSAPSVGTPVALPSGATVTLQADGSIVYDPNNAFDDLGVGLTARDSFTYELDTAIGSVVTVNVDLTGTNTDPQISITALDPQITEGSGASFQLTASAAVSGPVDVTVSFGGLADHLSDFTGQTTVQIPNAGSSATLNLSTIDDNLYEAVENIIVTIASVNGNAVPGASVSAETVVADAQATPEISIAADQASVAEGVQASFTITPSVTSQADRTVSVAYSGVAVNGVDFFATTTLVIPGGSPTAGLVLDIANDAVAEGDEALTVTLTGVDVGTLAGAGVGGEASTTITDGDAECLFLADFENVDPGATPGSTLEGLDAPFAANLGTAVGTWEGVFTVSAAGDAPGVILEGDDTKGDLIDYALRLDRPGPPDGDVFANLTGPADFSGANSAVFSLDLGTRRTQTGSLDKSYRIIGLDDFGEKSFELFVEASNNLTNHEQLHWVDSAGGLNPIGNVADFDNTGGYNESRMTRIVVLLVEGGYQVSIDKFPIDGLPETITGVLPYAGTARQLSSIHFMLSASTDTGVSSGLYLDDLKVGGIKGNVGPSAALDGTSLAQGGASALSPTFIGIGTLLDTLQVEDPDAGSAPVSASFRSVGVAPLTFTATASGGSTISGNGSPVLTIEGSLADVNATLDSGVTYITDAVTGGDASIEFSISDNGNTGPGGAKTLTHNLNFFVNEGPIVTIDLAPGQAARTSTPPVEFSVTFSEAVTGFDAGDVDLSASTDPAPLVASVSGSAASYTVSVSGMTGFGDVTISLPKGAANAVSNGAASEASTATADTVTYVPNAPPTATNLNQLINYVAGPVDIDDIVVFDANDSVVTTALAPVVDFPAVDPDAVNIVDPATDEGFALQLAFTPDAFGLDSLGTVRVFEIGGTSNGNGVYLIDGTPHFVRKMDSVPADVPESRNDSDMTNNNISIPLTTTPLVDGELAVIALVADLDTVTYSVNGMGATTVNITNRTTQSNWSGDDTVRIGENFEAGPGGLGTDPGGDFDEFGFLSMLGPVSLAQMWHAPDASVFSIQAVNAPEEITAALLVTPGDGDLSVPAGVSYDAGAGLWSIVGSVAEVNAAFAAVQFLPNGTSPVTISVLIEDGDEDGGGPLTGSITLSTGPLNADTDGDGIPDDFETANGLNPNDPADGGSDNDHDGWSALDEYLMGTNLNDGTDSPVFEVVHVSASEVQITYGPILAGRTYDVVGSTDGDTFGTVIDSFTAPADAAANSAIDSTGDLDVELYKLEVTVP